MGEYKGHHLTADEVEKKLKRMYWMQMEEAAKERKLKEMETQATHITASFSATRTSNMPTSKVENYAVNSYELVMDIEEMLQKLRKEQKECNELIELLDDPRLKAILTDYHCNGIKLSKIEKIYHYSRSQIHVLRKKAYQEISNKTQ